VRGMFRKVFMPDNSSCVSAFVSCAIDINERGLWPQCHWEFAHLRRTSKTWLTISIFQFDSLLTISEYLV